MDPRQPGKLELAVTLVTTLVTVWWVMPEPERDLIKRRALWLAHRASARLARTEGRRGMSDELAGRDYHRYAVAYQLSRARDGLAAVIEEMRP